MTKATPSDPVHVWTYKPWWCQPWSIVFTGVGAIATSWAVFHRLWLTGVVALPVLSWMGYFLLVYPKLFAQLHAQQVSGSNASDVPLVDDRQL